MNSTDEKMKFINFINPILKPGKHVVSATQSVTKPQDDTFQALEDFYVTDRVFTMNVNDVFSASPAENECSDFSKMLPFVTIDKKSFPWNWKIAEDIGTTPVPWVALIVLSSAEKAEEKDIPISELFAKKPDHLFFPERKSFPDLLVENQNDLCHVVELSKELYDSIMPSYEDMTCLTHGRKVNLADTADSIAAKDGEFSVIMANRFIPTGKTEKLKSTVHLVSLLGVPKQIPPEFTDIRLVSLFHWDVYSLADNSETFQSLIDKLSKNTGIIGFDQKQELLNRCFVPKEHYTRSGELTYSLYRSPLIPYRNKEMNCLEQHTADGLLIYDPKTGTFDASYAAAFQIGRLITLSHKADGQTLLDWRKDIKLKDHQEQLRASITVVDVAELCKIMIEEMS